MNQKDNGNWKSQDDGRNFHWDGEWTFTGKSRLGRVESGWVDMNQVGTCYSPTQTSRDTHFTKSWSPFYSLLDPVTTWSLLLLHTHLPSPSLSSCCSSLAIPGTHQHSAASGHLYLLPHPGILTPSPPPLLIASLPSGFYSNASLSEGPFLTTTNKTTHLLPRPWLQHPFLSLPAFIFLIHLPPPHVCLFI